MHFFIFLFQFTRRDYFYSWRKNFFVTIIYCYWLYLLFFCLKSKNMARNRIRNNESREKLLFLQVRYVILFFKLTKALFFFDLFCMFNICKSYRGKTVVNRRNEGAQLRQSRMVRLEGWNVYPPLATHAYHYHDNISYSHKFYLVLSCREKKRT